MDSADIAAVIPTFNRAHCIRHAVDSVLNQSLRCREVIVVDDGSTDGTAEALSDYGSQITIIRQLNQGVSVARNRGVHLAKATWVAFLDSDDEWDPNKIRMTAQAIERFPRAVAHVCNGLLVDGGGNCVDYFKARGMGFPGDGGCYREQPFEDVTQWLFMMPGVTTRRVEISGKFGFLPGLSMFEDYELLLRLSVKGAFIVEQNPLFRVFRRDAAGESLSKRNALKEDATANNLIRVYENILSNAGLTTVQAKRVRRMLSSARSDLAAQARNRRERGACIRYYWRSIRDCPSASVILRAFVGSVMGTSALNHLRQRFLGAPVKPLR